MDAALFVDEGLGVFDVAVLIAWSLAIGIMGKDRATQDALLRINCAGQVLPDWSIVIIKVLDAMEQLLFRPWFVDGWLPISEREARQAGLGTPRDLEERNSAPHERQQRARLRNRLHRLEPELDGYILVPLYGIDLRAWA